VPSLGSRRAKRKSNRLALLLLPALVFIFFMGWSAYWIGNQKRPKRVERKIPKDDGVTFLPIILEETPEIMNE